MPQNSQTYVTHVLVDSEIDITYHRKNIFYVYTEVLCLEVTEAFPRTSIKKKQVLQNDFFFQSLCINQLKIKKKKTLFSPRGRKDLNNKQQIKLKCLSSDFRDIRRPKWKSIFRSLAGVCRQTTGLLINVYFLVFFNTW